MPLESVGSYRLVELLGSGAMGEVYKATDGRMFDRVVALKLLSEKYARNENARSRFQNEVQYAAHLDHPNIVKIYDHGEIDGRPYFVMEFLDGIDLARFMKEETSRNIERSVEIARQLCEALDFAHRHNVVHRDVKPANVMIIRRGGAEQVKLVDFGIIHVESSKMTRDGTQPGTSAYSSPEQLRNDPVDHRSDLFSLGIVLYELFTNTYPFDAPSEALITHHILQREPESPRKRNATIPAAVDVLIMKLLEKDPAQRPQTAGEVAEALRQQLRKLQSRWASTDPAEYENLDEITREAVDKLVAWARQKEADGLLQEAVDAYEKALRLAPESDRIQRRIPKLRHRIESERLLKDHLAKAATALAEGHFPEARDHWKNAWILSPESEDVAALELRIENAEKAVPDDSERKQFVENLVARAEEALDAGRLDEARAEVVQILQRYPKDPLANFMLERILSILMAGVDYAAYRKAIREARDLIDGGRFAEARERCVRAQALWPGDEEATSVDREIGERIDGEVAAIAARVEKNLLRADDPDVDDKAAFELLAAVRAEGARARSLGSQAAWIRSSEDEADRVERAVKDRVARAESFRREQDEQRRKRIDMFLQRGRNQMADADVLAGRVTTEPAPAIEAYGAARESFERVLQDDATHPEALEARRRIEEQLRDLAVRVDEALARERELERERERQREREAERERAFGAALEAARSALAEVEIAGGARAPDLGLIGALLNEADLALDGVVLQDPRNSDAVPLRERAARIRLEIAEEQARRDAQAKEAERREEARKAAEAKADAEAKAKADAEARAKAEEDQRRRVEAERREREAAERRKAEQQRDAAEFEKEREHAGATKAAEAVPADARKVAEFEKGLAKHRRLVHQGKAREAAEIQRILQKEAAADPQLQALYSEAFPDEPGGGSRRLAVWGALAGLAVVGVVAVWFFTRGGGEPTVAPPPPPKIEEVKSEPFAAAAPEPAKTFDNTPPPEAHDEAPAVASAQAGPVPKPKPGPVPVSPAAVTPKPAVQPSSPAAYPAVPSEPPKTPATTTSQESSPAAKPPEPSAAPADTGEVTFCVTTVSGASAGAGYSVVFSVNGQARVSAPTDASGCVSTQLQTGDGSVTVQPTYVRGPQGERIETVQPPGRKLYQGQSQRITVGMKS